MSKLPSKSFCPYPWLHLHAWPTGRAMLCCVAHGGENGGEVGDFSQNTYAEIMNSDKMKQIRLDMLAGRRVSECSPCWENEDLGKNSYRENVLRDYDDVLDEFAKRTAEDGTLLEISMGHMDYRFSNLCNLGCRTCGSPLSSTIANEVKDESEIQFLKSKGVLSERETITSFTYKRPDFMETDVFPYINDNLRSFYFAGGEPLITPQHYEILKYLDENKIYEKQIVYSTNMTTLSWKGIDFLDIWKKFNKLQWFASIDGYKESLEYIRKGSKHDTVFRNLDRVLDLRDQNPDKDFQVKICYTHSIYNAYTTGDFYNFLNDNGYIDRLDSIEFNYAYSDNNSVSILPDFAKEELKQKRKEMLDTPGLQKAFAKWKHNENAYRLVDEIIDRPCNPQDFNTYFTKKFTNKYISTRHIEQLKSSLPWLGSVIERDRNV